MNLKSKLFSSDLFKTLICIAACLPVMLGGAGGLVLCFGHGGHIAIEPVHDDHHHSPCDHQDEHSDEHHLALSHEDCNSCFDIPLTVEETDQLIFDKEDNRIADLLAFDTAPSVHAAAIRADENLSLLAHRLSLPLPDSLEELRATVLRT